MGEQRQPESGHLRSLILSAVMGFVLGVLAKVADQSPIPGLGDLGTYLGVWIVIITAVAVTSPSRSVAALRSSLLMASMVLGYYLAAYLYFRVTPLLDITVWGLAAITGVPALAAMLWSSRGDGWSAAFAVALPVGLLAAEAFGFRFYPGLHPAPLVFDLIALSALLWLLPHDSAARLKAAVAALPVAVVGYWAMTIGFGYGAGLLLRAVG